MLLLFVSHFLVMNLIIKMMLMYFFIQPAPQTKITIMIKYVIIADANRILKVYSSEN